ncbi:MAG: hypothetical protein N3A61_00765 [Ignavibacteria bacterium]|nr:hypothetical protein [Ignavibacteria bacterium]
MKIKKQNQLSLKDLPHYCDYSCKYAKFSDPSAIGACRKELAVWCSYLKKYNNKNAKCLVRL